MKTDKQKEEQLKKRREAQQKRRLLFKIYNPKAHEEHLLEEREKYQRKKDEGKIKCHLNRSKTETKIWQKKKRVYQQKYRAKQKRGTEKQKEHSDTGENLPSTSNTRESHQRINGNKRANKLRRQCYVDNDNLRKDNINLRKKMDCVRKRIERLKLKKERKREDVTKSSSPISNVQKFLNGRPVPNDVEQRLVFTEVLKKQFKTVYNSSHDTDFKKSLNKTLYGKIIKKYKQQSTVKKYLNISRTEDILRSSHNYRILQAQTLKGKIKQFLEDNSQIDPGKRSTITVKKNKQQKHVLNSSLKDLYSKFKEDTKLQVSYKTFCRYRPFYFVQPIVTARDTCACKIHENFKLLIKSMHKNGIIKENSYHQMIESIICTRDNRSESCYFNTCTDCKNNKISFDLTNATSNFSYEKWIKEKEERINALTKEKICPIITKISTVSVNKSELDSLFHLELKNFLVHEYQYVSNGS